MKVLWGTRKGAPDWAEEIITTKEEHIGAARAWATVNGFDRFRIAVIPDAPEAPDFTSCINK